MELTITTKVSKCHLQLTISNSTYTLLTLNDNDTGTVTLLPGVIYLLEWGAVAGNVDGTIEVKFSAVGGNAPGLNGFRKTIKAYDRHDGLKKIVLP